LKQLELASDGAEGRSADHPRVETRMSGSEQIENLNLTTGMGAELKLVGGSPRLALELKPT
jgi:hypothetical protein